MQTTIGVAQSIYVIALLSRQKDNKPLKSHKISTILHVSDSYLRKIIRKLVVAGILASNASKTGGLSLNKKPEDITLLDIFLAIEDSSPFFKCSSIISKFETFEDPYFIEKGLKTISYFNEAEKVYKEKLRSHTVAELLDMENSDTVLVDFNKIPYEELTKGNIMSGE